MVQPPPTVYRTAEVAYYLQVSDATVRRWLREGQLRGVYLGATKSGWRIPRPALEEFLAARGLVPAEPPPPAARQ
jgi:excisionase family DNA binding protein